MHPLVESGRFQEDGTFFLDRSYLGVWRYPDHLQRRGAEMTFHSEHRPIEAYSRAFEEAGFLIEAFREPMPDEPTAAVLPKEERWRRIPNFLMVRARLDQLPAPTAGRRSFSASPSIVRTLRPRTLIQNELTRTLGLDAGV